MKTCPTVLTVREMQIETSMSHHLTVARMLRSRRQKNIDDNAESGSLVYAVKNVGGRDGSVSERACYRTMRIPAPT